MNHRLLKTILPGFALLLLLFLVNNARNYAAESPAHAQAESGTLQRMIVESGTVTMELDLSRLNGISSAAEPLARLNFAAAANSFFPILVFNALLRGPEAGSIAMVSQSGAPALPAALSASLIELVLEKLSSDAAF